jgi:murein DD-endopeptidase MepM/ murein hydrolase activator NlpD
VYGHLSTFKKGLQVGSKVKQGEVIGRVGQTGLATGPHLHYEFRVAGQHRNPLTIKLPSAIALNKAQMPAFKRDVAPLLAKLETVARETMVASAFPNEG